MEWKYKGRDESEGKMIINLDNKCTLFRITKLRIAQSSRFKELLIDIDNKNQVKDRARSI